MIDRFGFKSQVEILHTFQECGIWKLTTITILYNIHTVRP